MTTNRVIKFRQWHDGRVYFWGFDAGDDGSFFSGPVSGGRLKPSTSVHMQFTGLHDKNGKEIYEGDIIRIEDDYADNPTVHTVEYGVGYGYPAFEFNPQLECECNGFSYVMQGGEATIEVIGNIYETPELLEQSND